MENTKKVIVVIYERSKTYLNDLVRVSVSWGFILLLSQVVGMAPAQAPTTSKLPIDSCKIQHKRIETKLDYLINHDKK